MKTTQIRKSVFETNSSSCHSFSVAPMLDAESPIAGASDNLSKLSKIMCENKLFKTYKTKIDLSNIYFGEYHWGYEEYHSAEEKISYILAIIKSGSPEGALSAYLKSISPCITLVRDGAEITDEKEIYDTLMAHYESLEYDYNIDHQSSGLWHRNDIVVSDDLGDKHQEDHFRFISFDDSVVLLISTDNI